MKLRVLTAVIAVGFMSTAMAHFPTLHCQLQSADSGDKLHCLAGYSDGSQSGEVELRVYSYEEELLDTVTTDSAGGVTLALPTGEFFIVFDPGHEAAAEFDYAELE